MATVIVVDDEEVLLHMIAALIEECGHRVMTATNGKEALELLSSEAEPPALVISDVMMPQFNGTDLTLALKDDPRFRDVPVVLMSAAGRPPNSHTADAFIHKPFDLDVLEAVIERYIQHAS